MKKLLIALFALCLSTQAHAVSATGGTVTNYTLNGISYRAHVFTMAGTNSLMLTTGGDVECLIVGGGGGSGGIEGSYAAGAGGAGGFIRTNLNLSTTGSYAVVVGAGGSGGPAGSNPNYGSNGSNSSFTNLIALGGGGGGGAYSGVGSTGRDGGSGGGGGPSVSGGNGTTGQGANGGSGFGYGGGASGTGQSGRQSDISGTNIWYASGGSNPFNSTAPDGGGGRGDAVENANLATDGKPNTGGGGGARWGGNLNGKSGGSGIVIVRYVTGGEATVAAWYEWQPNLCFQANAAIKDGESSQ
jgi:hypothetical protein